MAKSAQFFVFKVDGTDSFYHCDNDGAPIVFDTQADAVTKAKEYSGEILILRAVAKVTERATYKVEAL